MSQIAYPNIHKTQVLYSAFNFTLKSGSVAGSTFVTGSPVLNAMDFYSKSVYSYIHTTQNASGAYVVSGSLDGTNYFQLKSGSLNSGSFTIQTFTDVVPTIRVYLYNSVTGSDISGSLYVVGQY